MIKPDMRIVNKDLAQYARHSFTCIDLSDLEEGFSYDKWDGLVLDVRALNAIDPPWYYWKRGTLRPVLIDKPLLYIASARITSASLPPDRCKFDGSRLEGIRLMTKDISGKFSFWQVEPIYEDS